MTEEEMVNVMRPLVRCVADIALAGGTIADALAALPPYGTHPAADSCREGVGRIFRAAQERAAREAGVTTFSAWVSSDHPRGQPGNRGQFAPKGGAGAAGAAKDKAPAADSRTAAPAAGKQDTAPKTAPASVPARKPLKATHAARRYRDTARRRRVIKAVRNEGELSAAIDGANLPDSEPADVVVMTDPEGRPITDPAHVKAALKRREWAARRLKQANLSDADREHCQRILASPCALIEVKTLLVAKGNAVHMSGAAQGRKARWMRKFAATFYTVALDDRRGAKHSGNRAYVVHGFASTVRLDQMEKVSDLAAVRGHIEATSEEGKVEARRVSGVQFSQGVQS